MSLREHAVQEHPNFPWLSADDSAGIQAFLRARQWLQPDEAFLDCEPAGQGRMNLTLRIKTSQRSLILKQARPWVERFDHIAAPWDRMVYEHRFYVRVATLPSVAPMMADLYGYDEEARAVLIEDIPGAEPLFGLYREGKLAEREAAELARWLRALHEATRGPVDPQFANRAMRQLVHEHMFVVPLKEDNGLDLDTYEPGLKAAAEKLRQDEKYMHAVRETGERYLADGACLVHGDFFPGSWLRAPQGLRIIDAECCHWGDPEFDLARAVAHFALARQRPIIAQAFLAHYHHQPGEIQYDPERLSRYAAAEVMRRLIGVSQLPVPHVTEGWRADLLERSRKAMLEKSLDPIWGRK